MSPDESIATATGLMGGFARRTGLESGTSDASGGQPRRYLWTDAFATCNFQGLAEAGAAPHFREMALQTVAQVHRELGHHRDDDPRTGWLHGPHGTADAAHPTRSGLRIGKPLPERGSGERFDERLEWDRDGQYFHYLTRWMHALDQLAGATGTPRFNLWARELADTAHRAFTHYAPGGGLRMYWKMSTDLSRPLVPSMGQHDPLDGYVTAVQLQASAQALDATEGPDLRRAASDYAAINEGAGWSTADPLGIGGLLMDAFRLEQLMRGGLPGHARLLDRMLRSAALGLRHYPPPTGTPADTRLGFRELGLAIGLAAIEALRDAVDDGRFAGGAEARRSVGALCTHAPLREEINAFWLLPVNRSARSWTDHLDINEVMLATSLAPSGWLVLSRLR